jgi:hypothetical protein
VPVEPAADGTVALAYPFQKATEVKDFIFCARGEWRPCTKNREEIGKALYCITPTGDGRIELDATSEPLLFLHRLPAAAVSELEVEFRLRTVAGKDAVFGPVVGVEQRFEQPGFVLAWGMRFGRIKMMKFRSRLDVPAIEVGTLNAISLAGGDSLRGSLNGRFYADSGDSSSAGYLGIFVANAHVYIESLRFRAVPDEAFAASLMKDSQ